MISTREQFYNRRIAELESQLRQRDVRISTLEKQVAELLKANEALVKKNAELAEKVAKLKYSLTRRRCLSSKVPLYHC
ncbi:hypothetical protein KA005_85270 [bacterium]|nr:hypothetical protein [bacterium]